MRSRTGSDRHELAHPIGGHVLAASPLDDLAALHDEVLVGQFFGKVIKLLDQDDGHLLPVQPLVGQFADGTANVLDDAGLDALGGLVQDQQLGAGSQGAGNGELLLLAAREFAATAVQHLFEHGKELEELLGQGGAARFAGQAHL